VCLNGDAPTKQVSLAGDRIPLSVRPDKVELFTKSAQNRVGGSSSDDQDEGETVIFTTQVPCAIASNRALPGVELGVIDFSVVKFSTMDQKMDDGPSVHTEKASRGQIAKLQKSPIATWFSADSILVKARLPLLGMSIVALHREVLYFSLHTLQGSMTLTPNKQLIHLQLGHLQIDNMKEGCVYPVVLKPSLGSSGTYKFKAPHIKASGLAGNSINAMSSVTTEGLNTVADIGIGIGSMLGIKKEEKATQGAAAAAAPPLQRRASTMGMSIGDFFSRSSIMLFSDLIVSSFFMAQVELLRLLSIIHWLPSSRHTCNIQSRWHKFTNSMQTMHSMRWSIL
jgi:hypothetical protein